MKIEVSIDFLKDFWANYGNCKNCKYRGTNCFLIGKSCNDSEVESLIEKLKLVLDFDSAILGLEKLKRKCTENQTDGLFFAIGKLEEIKEEFQK